MKKALLIILASLAFTTLSAHANTSKSPFNCAKKTCSQIKSCSEAKYKLKNCGHKKLDRDRDGIPCEKICGH